MVREFSEHCFGLMLTRQTNVKKEVLFKVFTRIVLLFSYGKLQNFREVKVKIQRDNLSLD